jgi:hypothetical protein
MSVKQKGDMMRATANNIKAYRAAVSDLDHYDTFGKCYFFHSPSCANMRRSYEAKNSIDNTHKLGEDILRIVVSISCSCKNVYADRVIYLNDVQLKNSTKAKNLLKRIGAELQTKGKLAA